MAWWMLGWVEVARELHDGELLWSAAVDAGKLALGHDDAYGCFFGFMNYANFRPIAPERGIPPDASERVKEEMSQCSDFASPTWISWSEIKAIDWEEKALEPDSRVYMYHRQEDGKLVPKSKSAWNREWAELTGASIEDALHMRIKWAEDQEWEIGDRVYRVQTMRRKDVLTQEWQTLFKVMEALASQYGDERVRLVVWFLF